MDSVNIPRISPRAGRTLFLVLLAGAAAGQTAAQGYKIVCADAGIQPNELTQGPDGTFYGTTVGGGNNLVGTVFKMDSACNVTVLHHFAGNPGDGEAPRGGLLLADDNFLYGTTYAGGTDDVGTVFRIDTAGGNYSFVSQLTPSGLCGALGHGPYAAPMQASDDGIYVPMTVCGPSGPNGTSSGAVVLVTPGLGESAFGYFDPLGDMIQPAHRLAEGPDTSLYGIARESFFQTDHFGAVYKMPLGGGNVQLVHAFTGPEGATPDGPLALANDGSLWGMTTNVFNPGFTGPGTIFRIPSGGALSAVYAFAGSEGPMSEGGLVQAGDDNLYGMTVGTNLGNEGSVFRVDLAGNYQKLATVRDTEIGRVPYRGLYRAMDGKLYGQCLFTVPGGSVGTYFSIDVTQRIDSITPTSGTSAGGTNVSILGDGFVAGAEVEFDTVAATGEAVPDAQHVNAVTPGTLTPGTLSTVRVRLPDTTLILLDDGWFADFLDVPQSDIFHPYVEAAVRNGITAGCGGGNYCRNNPVTRAQMAVFLLKAKYGAAYDPPDCTGIFPDVPCTPGTGFSDWIEQLSIEGITGGCGGGNYCPNDPVLRQQMAVFLLKTEHGSSYDPPDCTGVFVDVPCTPGAGFSDWIEQLVTEAITGGCATNPARYCPTNSVTRGQMAVFLDKTFD